MDGNQTPGINYNSIDGLTTVNATTISINGSTINLDSYVPYTSSNKTVNLNTQTLTNIANASALTDAVNQQTMNAKTYIGTLGSYRSEITSGFELVNSFLLQSNYSYGILCSQENYSAKFMYGQQINLYTPTYGLCGTIVPGTVGVLGINATNLNLTGAIGANGIITSNGSQIKNIANGTAIQDAVSIAQLSTLSSLVSVGVVTSSIVNGTTSIVCNGTNILYNTLGNESHNVGTDTSFIYESSPARQTITHSDGTYVTYFRLSINGTDAEYDISSGNPVVGFHRFNNKLRISPSATADAFKVTNNTGLTTYFSIDTSTPAINANSIKIINLATATNAADAVRFDQLPAAMPVGSAQGSYIIYNSGAYINNATNSINLGLNTYLISPSSINIGHSAGAGNSASISNTVNIGQSTGSSGQNSQTVAIGSNAGATNQGVGSVAIGYRAQRDNVVGGYVSVSIGSLAGSHDIGNGCVGIGGYAGYEGQSSNSVAIGYQAGYSNQHLSSIIINATGAQLNSLANAALYVAPVRSITLSNVYDWRGIQYNTTSKELAYHTSEIWNIIILGTATTNPSTSLPVVYYMPSGIKIDPATASVPSVVRVSQGYYTLTFSGASFFGFDVNYTTITTGMNSILSIGSDIVTAKVTGAYDIVINYFLANVVARDLQLGDHISLRVEF